MRKAYQIHIEKSSSKVMGLQCKLDPETLEPGHFKKRLDKLYQVGQHIHWQHKANQSTLIENNQIKYDDILQILSPFQIYTKYVQVNFQEITAKQ